MVAVGGTGVLVEVGVACGAATVDVSVGGEGWLPQDARKRNTTNIRTRVTGFVKSIDAVLAYGGRLLWFSGLDLLGFILFNKIHLQELHSPCQSVPKKNAQEMGQGQVCPCDYIKAVPFPGC
jgi:hypothetical protein